MTSEGSHHDAELRRWLVEVRERRSGKICGGTELERSSNGGGDLGLGFARRRLRLGEAKGVVRALFIGPVGDPWRADQGAAWGGVRRPDSLSPRRSREVDDPDRRDPPVSGSERKGRGVGLGFAGEESGLAEEFWAAGERKKERGRWAGPKGYREKRERLLFFQQKIQIIQCKFKFKRI